MALSALKPKDSIAKQILIAVFSVYFVVAATVTAIHMVVEYFNTKQTIRHDLEMFHKAFEPGLAQLLWNFERQELQEVLLGMLEAPVILGVRVDDEQGQTVAAVGLIMNTDGQVMTIDRHNTAVSLGRSQEWTGLFWETLPLRRHVTGQSNNASMQTIGKITLYSNSNVVFHRVKYAYLLLIVNALIKTGALWIIFLWVQRILLSRPLAVLTNATEHLTLDHLEGLQVEVKTQGRNELKILEESFNHMIQKMSAAKKSLLEKARMEQELLLAATVQRALLPKALPRLSAVELAAFYRSASETCGDWYGVAHISKYLYLMIGDVTGHGTPAALVSTTVSAICRTLEITYQKYTHCPSPGEFLEQLNHAVYATGHPEYLMTFFMARLDLETGKLRFANAGHNFPLVFREGGSFQHLLNSNPRLGYQEHTEYQEDSIMLQRDDLLWFYTDGLIENTNEQDECWSERRMLRCLRKYQHLSVSQVAQRVWGEAENFYNQTPPADDLSVLACRVTRSFEAKL